MYSPVMTYSPIDGYGFFIQNDIKTLDIQNEWYYNPVTKKIRIFSLNTPTNIKAACSEYLLQCNFKNYLTFTNINFEGANLDAIKITNSANIIIQNCNINYSGKDAINSIDCHYITVQNSTIKNSCDFAIFSSGADNYGGNTLISNNIITNTGIIPGSGSPMGQYAIKVEGSNSIVENNFIDSVGYIGIYFDGNNTEVNNNFINNFCLIKDDGSGIYTWNDFVDPITRTGQKIKNNIVLNGIGASAGTNSPSEALANGIYMDDNAANVEIYGNTIANCANIGIFIHNAHEINICNNTVYNCLQQLSLAKDAISSALIRNIIIKMNILFSKATIQLIFEHRSTLNDIMYFGNYDSNYYTRPILESNSISANPNNIWVTYNLEQWQTYSNQDANSHKSPKTINDTSELLFKYNPTSSPVTYTLPFDCIDIKNISYTGTITLAPYTSAVLIKNGSPHRPPPFNTRSRIPD
jgi:parallel beta-helix repeat protein